MEEKVLESRRIRIYPTKEQQAYLTFNMFANIKMWNALLAEVYKPVSELDEVQALPRNKQSKEVYKRIERMSWEEQRDLFKGLRGLSTKAIYDADEIVFESGWILKAADTSMYSYTLRTLKTPMSNHLKNPRNFGIPRFKTTMDVDNQGSHTSGAHV